MITKLSTLLMSFCFISCLTQDNTKINHIETLVLDRDHYVYELSHVTNANYPYKLWPFRIGGEYDGMHKIIAKAQKGSILHIHSKKIKKDLYIGETFIIEGIVKIQGETFNVETTINK